jgi:hypothetical protein
MKKVFIVLILFLSTLMVIPDSYSTFTAEENVIGSLSNWSVKYDNGSYYIESDFYLIEHDYLFLELGVSETETIEQEIIEPGQLSYVDFYLEPDISDTPSSTKYFNYEEQPWSSFMILVDSNVLDADITDPFNLGTYKGLYAKIKLQIKRDLSSYDRGQLIYILNSDDAAYILDWNFRAYNDISNPTTLLDLPETLGNPFENASLYYPGVDYYGYVDFSYINGDITLFITYQGYYVYTIPDVAFSDDSFLENVYSVYYYTVNDERYLYFTYQEDDDFVLTDGSIDSKAWKGFSIWNLTTNEISTTQRVWALTYIDVIDNVAFAYFVLPTIPVDDLISVSVTFSYRLGKNGISTLFQQKYLDWNTRSLVLQKDHESLEETRPQWVYNTLEYSTIGVVTIAALLAVTSTPITLPMVLFASIPYALAGIGALDDLLNENIDQLQQINYPSYTLVNKLNEHYSTVSGTQVDVSSKPIYMLSLGEYSGYEINYVEFDISNYKYTEIVWMTNGTVYSISEDYIDSDVIVDQDYLASRPDESPKLNLMSFIMLPLITFIFIGLAWKTKAFSSFKQILLFVGLYLLVIFILV